MAGEKRIERLQRQILRILSKKVCYEMNDPRLGAMLTLTRVMLSKDMSMAKVYFSTIGSDKDRVKAERVLNHASSHLRRELGSELQVRILPTLEFKYDQSIDESIRISAKLDKLREEFMQDEDETQDSDKAQNDEMQSAGVTPVANSETQDSEDSTAGDGEKSVSDKAQDT